MKKLIRITTVPISLDKLLGKQLSFMSQHFDLTAVSADEQELKIVAKKYRVKHHHVEMTRAITPFKDLIAVWKMYHFLKKEQPEIIHTHTPKAGLVGLMAAYFAGVPLRMHTVAGLPLLEATGIKRKILNLVEKITYAFATKVYPNSFAMKDIIIQENFCAPHKLKVLGNGSSNGIDTAYFNRNQIPAEQQEQLRTTLGIAPDDFIFIFVGRLVSDKGINELVSAFKAMAQPLKPSDHQLSTKLLFVGPLETKLDPLLPETIREIEENPNIISTGYQDDVRPYFAIADALVFPSYREGFPNVVLQAGAMELPAIVSNINGCNEIIVEGENGLIIPAKNTVDLKEAMLKLITDQALYDHLEKNSRSRIVDNYEQAVVWRAILAEYKSLENNV